MFLDIFGVSGQANSDFYNIIISVIFSKAKTKKAARRVGCFSSESSQLGIGGASLQFSERLKRWEPRTPLFYANHNYKSTFENNKKNSYSGCALSKI
uniref:Uncharacterized protein n=1 Tax=Vibrio sp. FF_482 TaxID=1652836 RepID=A0A0H3ZKZ5_9VIBR|nr:hypothetical protein [Vibrio sp. FF_482]